MVTLRSDVINKLDEPTPQAKFSTFEVETFEN